MLGDDVLVAPVLDLGVIRRDIYLPQGQWRDQNQGNVFQGPTWLKDHPADLYTLPYFLRV